MDIWHALTILVIVLVLVETLLLIALVMPLRSGGLGTRKSELRPDQGFHIDLSINGEAWPPNAHQILSGTSLIMLVQKNCTACRAIRAQLSSMPAVPFPVYAIVDGSVDGAEDYRQDVGSWKHVASSFLSPRPIHALGSFDEPQVVPTLVLANDGTVIARSYRLRDIPGFASKPDASR